MANDISVIILAANEKLHMRRCMERLLPLYGDSEKVPPGRVFVIDCFSTDGTQEIARELGAEVVEHKWPGLYAPQFNWALDNLPIKTKWVLRLDADEYLYPDTIKEIQALLPTLPEDVTSLSLSRARVWMGRIIRHGTGKVILKRFFRYGKGRCEERMMDEHIVTTEGRDLLLNGAFADDNLNDLGWWTKKHVGYAEREAIDLLGIEYGLAEKFQGKKELGIREEPQEETVPNIGAQAAEKRAKKVRYARMPLFWRSFAYFCYRYLLRGGFLEGKEGFMWHFFQGWWYRTLVDARVWEIKREAFGPKYADAKTDREKIEAWIADHVHH